MNKTTVVMAGAFVLVVLITAIAIGASLAQHRAEISYRYCLSQGNEPAECRLARV